MEDLSNENILHVKKENVEYLQFKKLLQYPEIVHGYTLSKEDFDIGSNDTYKINQEIFEKNYHKLQKALQVNKQVMVRPYQTHTDVVKCIEEPYQKNSIFKEELENVDGLLTDCPQMTLLLSYADCTPIYLYDPIKKVIGNIHSGWMGTLKGIGKIAVKKMIEQYECDPKNIVCCLGPHIRKCHFEVSEKVAKDFQNRYGDMQGIETIIVHTKTQGTEKNTILIQLESIKI